MVGREQWKRGAEERTQIARTVLLYLNEKEQLHCKRTSHQIDDTPSITAS
eukprot:c30072_g1_i1 orf=145-294(+)